MRLIHGDSNEELYKITGVDTIITDPPYGLKFMGKKWDYDVPSVQFWKKALASCKPGATALVFAGSRTYHRMAVNMEDAGWILKDTIMWLYGSGFPKATDISKQLDKMGLNQLGWIEFSKAYKKMVAESNYNHNDIDKHLGIKVSSCYWARTDSRGGLPPVQHWNKIKEFIGIGNEFDELYKEAEREVVGQKKVMRKDDDKTYGKFRGGMQDITLAETDSAKLWNGWKSHGLKPAYEPILVAVKPNDGTYANNALKHGVSGLNIDGGRIGETVETWPKSRSYSASDVDGHGSFRPGGKGVTQKTEEAPAGRFPANIILDKEAGEMLGEPARFFYCAKSSKRERNSGLDSTCTVKYNTGIGKEENMVAVQLLQKVISDTEVMSFNIDESGENIMALCRQDSLSITLTTINKIIESKILHLLMRSLTNGYIADANSETESGGSHAESVESLRKWLLTTTNEQMELAHGVSLVASQMLSKTKNEEDWSPLTNIHSTVKPLALMEYLVKLTATPTGGKVLDPFMGSGTTGVACKREGRDFIGIDNEEEYVEIARARIENA